MLMPVGNLVIGHSQGVDKFVSSADRTQRKPKWLRLVSGQVFIRAVMR